MFPLTFIANTFVPVGGLPDGLRQVAEYNPISAWAAAVRTLFGNPTAIPDGAAWPLEHPVIASVAWCVAILAIVVPLTVRAYRKRTRAEQVDGPKTLKLSAGFRPVDSGA